MPPKGAARPRGGIRSGRGGRGAALSNQAVQQGRATPQDAASSVGAAQSTDPTVVPKQEGDTDATDTNVSATVEPSATSIATFQTLAEPSARAPRQRLDSLKSVEPPSRSASPSVRRGTSNRGKKPVALPSFSGRRSKEERDARTAADAEREKERHAKRDADAERKRMRKEKAEERARESATKGRGGYSGAVSGPFSMAASRDKKASQQRNFANSGGGSGSRATRVKDEHDAGPSGRSGGSSNRRKIGEDDVGYISSEDEDDAAFPRKDIDLIEISSDEGEDAPSARANLPVRIGRKEHRERVVGINTDASTETSAKLLQEAEASGKSPSAEGLEGKPNKGKGKAKDVEITGERRPFKGMWQNAEDMDTKVKAEPTSDVEDEMIVDSEQVGIGAGAKTAETAEGRTEAERKPKLREKKEPQLQTDEERAEWARFQANLRHVREELGPDYTSTVDGSGDVHMDDAAANASKPSRRDNHTYLLQLPPIIPELHELKVKKEHADVRSKAPGAAQHTNQTVQIKQEAEGEFSSVLPMASQGPKFASGRVGMLRVHQSGRTTLDWGGVDYELTPGKSASFLQEVVSLRIDDEKNRVAEEMGGDAVSLGRVKGKFVVTPDFSTIFG